MREPVSDRAARKADVQAKQDLVARLLAERGLHGLLVLDPANFGWLTGGASVRGVTDPGEWPALFFTVNARWVACSNVDSQRLFDEELDGLGFQLKEWPWDRGRDRLLADLVAGAAAGDKRVAADRPVADCLDLGGELAGRRLALSPYERDRYARLGSVLAHALEASARSFGPGESEAEVAGQIGHRLLKRGADPVSVSVAADGRSGTYRRPGFTAVPVKRWCVVAATASQGGLTATASRTVCFGPPGEELASAFCAATLVTAAYVSAVKAGRPARDILACGQLAARGAAAADDPRPCPPGCVTGRLPVERPLTPRSEERVGEGWALTLQAGVRAAFSCDTVLVTSEGPLTVTAPDGWPVKRVRAPAGVVDRPDLLVR